MTGGDESIRRGVVFTSMPVKLYREQSKYVVTADESGIFMW